MSDRPAVPFTVVGGYLGAGKTTLVNRILTAEHGRRIAVIVNDFGDVAVDAGLIESEEGSVRSLANGCVCCTLTDGFASTLRELGEREPPADHVLVEVSGVGDPWAVAQWGRTPGFALDGVVVVVDPETIVERLGDRYVGDTVRGQLEAADLVLLSRADVTAASGLDTASAAVSAITDAPVLRGTDVALDLLLGRPTLGAPSSTAHAEHTSWSCRPRPAHRSDLTAWLEAAPDGVVRVKGFVDADGDADGQLVGQRVGRRCEVTRHKGPRIEPVMTVVATGAADPESVDAWLARLVADVS